MNFSDEKRFWHVYVIFDRVQKSGQKKRLRFSGFDVFSTLKKHGDSESEGRIEIGPVGPEILTAPDPRCGHVGRYR